MLTCTSCSDLSFVKSTIKAVIFLAQFSKGGFYLSGGWVRAGTAVALPFLMNKPWVKPKADCFSKGQNGCWCSFVSYCSGQLITAGSM
jgi:hypothetical protein